MTWLLPASRSWSCSQSSSSWSSPSSSLCFFSALPRASCTTATALRPPLLTNSVRSSGDSARSLGSAPFSFSPPGQHALGRGHVELLDHRVAGRCRRWPPLSLLSQATNSRLPGRSRIILFGLARELDAPEHRGLSRTAGPAPPPRGHARWRRRPCRRLSTPPRTGIRRRARRPWPGSILPGRRSSSASFTRAARSTRLTESFS